jgi:hypothetical protein
MSRIKTKESKITFGFKKGRNIEDSFPILEKILKKAKI